ncbi:MAG TPA: polysaccharide deacetylase family protein [Roseiflexaceae bacterium]|nr:polysaccharide deacetylase family protein [Roseiflexaceae bacterium]
MSPYRRLDAIATMLIVALTLLAIVVLLPRMVAPQPLPAAPNGPATALVARAAATPVPAATSIAATPTPPLLPTATTDPLGYELSVTPELFAQHMALLAEQGYQGVTVATLVHCMRGEPICPPQPVALSFDDGYADAFSAALPVLERYDFQATFYIVGDFVGQPGYMSWEQLAALHAAGMEIGAHSMSHPDLTRLDAAELTRQVVASKQLLEERLGTTVESFCYPAGRYTSATIAAVQAAGYTSAVTTRWDSDIRDMLALPRRRIAGGTSAEALLWITAAP